MATPSPTSFLARAHKSEITRLKKKVAEIDKRIADMQAGKAMLLKELDGHEAEVKKIEAPPKDAK
jgi:septal ring factor EnvC (AmiA/AmiB activator)